MSTYEQTTIGTFASTNTAYAVEVDDTTVGIVIRDNDQAYTFFSALQAFFPLEQRRFSNPAAAQRAALALYRDRRGALRATAQHDGRRRANRLA